VSNAIRLPFPLIQSQVRYEKGSKLTGVIYMHRISDTRFTGISGRNFKMFRELCGDTSLKNVILITNMWGEVSQDVGEARERELTTNFFKPVLDKGAQLARHHNTTKSAYDIIRSIMRNQPMALQIQRELVDEGKNIIDTAAGEAAKKKLNEQIRHHQAKLKIVHEEMMQALKDKDEEARKEPEEETHKFKEQMDKMSNDSAAMASNHQEKRMEELMRQIRERARQDGGKADVTYRKQIDDLNTRLQESANASASKKGTITPLRVQQEPTGGAVNQEFEWFRRHQAELNAMREEMMQALRNKDKETHKVREELDRSRVELDRSRAELDRSRAESERMASAHNEERRRMEAEMWRREEEARTERGRLVDCLSGYLQRCPRCGQ
jgi:chromosome segregation ATPase